MQHGWHTMFNQTATDHSFAVLAISSADERVLHKVMLETLPQGSVGTEEVVHHLIAADHSVPAYEMVIITSNFPINGTYLSLSNTEKDSINGKLEEMV